MSKTRFIVFSLLVLITLSILNLGIKAVDAIQLPNTEQPIQIDGILEEDEWNSAYKIAIINETQQLLFILYFQNDKNSLYIAIDDLFDVTDNNSGSFYDLDHIFNIQTSFGLSFNASFPHRSAEFKIALSIFSSDFFGFACVVSEATSGQMLPFPQALLDITNQSAYQCL
ncbi:MAG: hypothetical protein ACTSRC_19340 [Candidatus Helarchaeota archaeon]